MKKEWTIRGKVKKFDAAAPWYYIPVRDGHEATKPPRGRWGSVPIKATVGDSTWNTSLFPMGKWGKNEYFIAINAKVRKKEEIKLGDVVSVKVKRR